MKTKFEDNVASEIPKTKTSQEPELPWKVSNADLEESVPGEDEYKSTMTGIPPLKTRAIFPIMLLVAIFALTVYFTSTSLVEKERVSEALQKKEAALASMQVSLEKISGEKSVLSESVAQLDKQVKDLASQKELFTTVIESLTKKTEETPQEKTQTESAPKAENPDIN